MVLEGRRTILVVDDSPVDWYNMLRDRHDVITTQHNVIKKQHTRHQGQKEKVRRIKQTATSL